MVEPIMYFGIGFLVAALLALMFVPLVHNRAVRLTVRRLEAATPLSIAEIRADKDQLRAEFAMSTRRLEMSVEQMKAKTRHRSSPNSARRPTPSISSRKSSAKRPRPYFALEARDKALAEQLRATEQEFALKTGALREAERALADKEAELAKLVGELGDQSIAADSQRIELAALRTQVEAMKVSVAGYERAVKEAEERLARERGEAERAKQSRPKRAASSTLLSARKTDLEQQLVAQTDRSRESSTAASQELEARLGEQGRLLAERDDEIERLRSEARRCRARREADLRDEVANRRHAASARHQRFRRNRPQLEGATCRRP